jgi:hypothetical protein
VSHKDVLQIAEVIRLRTRCQTVTNDASENGRKNWKASLMDYTGNDHERLTETFKNIAEDAYENYDVVPEKFTDDSDEHIAFIYRSKEYAKQESFTPAYCWLLTWLSLRP